MDDEITHNKNLKFFKSRGKVIIKNIIKEQTVNYSPPIFVGGESTFETPIDNEFEHEHEIEPIIENEEVVGVMHRCSCGKATEIRFDY